MYKRFRAIAVFAISLLFFTECNESNGPDFVAKRGRALAETHCGSCHQFPEPTLLPKDVWYEAVLPQMSSLFGLRHLEGPTYLSFYNDGPVTVRQWDTILRYFVKAAPDSLQSTWRSASPITNALNGFEAHPIALGLNQASTTCAAITTDEKDRIVLGDGFSQQLFSLSSDGKLNRKDSVGTCIAQVYKEGKETWVLTAGIMRPADLKLGALAVLGNTHAKAKPLFTELQRPVYSEHLDLNNDGRKDILMCEYGNMEGCLSWYELQTDGKYQKHILRKLPGAIRTAVHDFDGDGHLDIMALMAQADEGMFIYYQRPDGSFKETRILQFPPVYGTNYFELDDFNQDGHPDILTTNGDNGDFSPILKPFHGLRIFLNDGKNNFTEKLFLPVNGAGKAMAIDFDGDGDLDIASIAFFADFRHRPLESFIFWENLGGLNFKAFSGPEALMGHWLTMDVGDLNKDGKPDIVLGSANLELGDAPDSLRRKWTDSKLSAMILINKFGGKN